MKRAGYFLALAMAVTALALGNASVVHSQSPTINCRYFDRTGHYVCDEFLTFYDTRGGEELFGHPLTEAFDDPMRGLRVQYFQRARMEWHPYNPPAYQVQLGLLVDELGYSFAAARPEQIPASNNALHHYFPETGHVVSYAFLDYFRAKGGLDIFGYPRSEFMYEDGYIVQYFQRARMEWHPEADPDQRMRLTNLGELYIQRFGLPGEYDEPLPPPAMAGTPSSQAVVTSLDVSASVRYAITGRRCTQTVFVYVSDQRQKPVVGAQVRIVVRYQSGKQTFDFGPTNASGFARHSFDVQTTQPGEKVVVEVAATYQGMTGRAQTFFMPWW